MVLLSDATLLLTTFIFGQYITAHTSNSTCPDIEKCNETALTNNPCLSHCATDGNCCSDYTAIFPMYDEVEQSFECIVPTQNIEHAANEAWYEAPGVIMMTSCMTNLTDERCTNSTDAELRDILPHVSVTTGTIYRNIYCGLCNNDTDLTPWKAYFTCSDTNLVKPDSFLFPNTLAKTYASAIASTDPACGIELRPPDHVNVSHHLCYSETPQTDTCDEYKASSSNTCDHWLTYPYLLPANNETTYLCYFCNSSTSTPPDGTREPTDIKHIDNKFIARLNYENVSTQDMSNMFYEVDDLVRRYSRRPTQCAQDHLFDPYTEECRPWYCPRDNAFVDGVCVPIFSEIEKASFQIRLDITPENSSAELFETAGKYVLCLDLLSIMFNNDSRVNYDLILIAEEREGKFVYMVALLHILQRVSSTLMGVFGINRFEGNFTVPVGSDDFVQVDVSLTTAVKIDVTHFPGAHVIVLHEYQQEYTTMTNLYIRNETDIKTLYKYPIIDKLSFCIQILLDRNEFLDFGGIVEILESSLVLHTSDFETVAKSRKLRVCFNDYMRRAAEKLPYKDKPKVYSPQAIVSVTCNLMSITGLTATVITYFIFGELRSIPGKNNMMLSIHLLFAQCFYQFGIDQTGNPTLCIVLGVLIHLFWLTAILWMNACTLHMFRTFVTGQSYRSYRALDPQVCCYTIYCYTVALIIIAITIGVSMFKSGGQSTGYGGHVCYINEPVMVGWTFALPVGVIIILNTGFFFAVVYQISASTMSRRGKSNDRANTIIYMKLSSLTGVTWIFGYLYLWTDFIPLEYIFIVLNAGQGVLIFVSFICTSRIIRLYQDLFRKMRRACQNSDCCSPEEKIPERRINAIEMGLGKHDTSTTSRTQDTAVVMSPTGNATTGNFPCGSVLIKPSQTGVVIIGNILKGGAQSEHS